jgi:hypothetical protein
MTQITHSQIPITIIIIIIHLQNKHEKGKRKTHSKLSSWSRKGWGEWREWKEMLTSGLPVSVPDVRRSCHHRNQRQRQSHLRRPVLLLQLPHQSPHLFPRPSAVALSLSFLPDTLLARPRTPLSLVDSALETLKVHSVSVLSLSYTTLKTLKVHSVSSLSLSYTPPWKP